MPCLACRHPVVPQLKAERVPTQINNHQHCMSILHSPDSLPPFAILCRLTPLFSRLRSRLCLRALTQSRWLGKPVKNLSPVNATFEAPPPPSLQSFASPPLLKIHHKVIFFAKYPVNSIKVISPPPSPHTHTHI